MQYLRGKQAAAQFWVELSRDSRTLWSLITSLNSSRIRFTPCCGLCVADQPQSEARRSGGRVCRSSLASLDWLLIPRRRAHFSLHHVLLVGCSVADDVCLRCFDHYGGARPFAFNVAPG